MKKCNTEIMKEIKLLNVRKEELRNYELLNSTVSFLKNEEKTFSKYNYDEITKELEEIDKRILFLKEKLDYSNATTIVPEFNMTISSCLTYLALLQNRKNRYYNLSLNEKLTRLGTTRDGQVEFKETCYDPEICKKKYEDICLEINKLQIAIDRINLTNEIEL